MINGEVQRAILHAGPSIACGSLGYYPSSHHQQQQQQIQQQVQQQIQQIQEQQQQQEQKAKEYTSSKKTTSGTSTITTSTSSSQHHRSRPSSRSHHRSSTDNMTDLTSSGLQHHTVELQETCTPSRASYGRGVPSWSDGRAAYTHIGTTFVPTLGSTHSVIADTGGGRSIVSHAASLDNYLNTLEPLIPSIPAELEEHLRTCRCTCNHMGYGNYQVSIYIIFNQIFFWNF